MADPKRQLQGRLARVRGKAFEDRISVSLDYYRARGYADIEKTPEPMKIIRSLEQGRFIACFQKKAQPDYKGIIKGGREILLEAKYTASDRLLQSCVNENEAEYLSRHQSLGARCYVIAGFSDGSAYKIPWDVWSDMKARFARKYVTETDLQQYKISVGWNGVLLLLD